MPSRPADEFSVLVVDDDPGVRTTLGDILELHGFAVISASSGEAAIDLVSRGTTRPGLVLQDLQLPDMNGLELAELLRGHVPELQIVVLTGNASLDSALSAMRSGTADYLVKPVSPPSVIRAVKEGRDRWRSAQVEAALLGNLERFRALIENLSEVVTVIEPNGNIVYESPAVKQLLGYDVRQRLGQRFDQPVHPNDRRLIEGCIADTRNGSLGSRCTVRVKDAGGNWKSIEISASRVVRDTPIDGLILTSRDVTDRLRLEAQLRQAQKMEAIGQLTGGMAHELNNLLTVVTANAEVALRELPVGSDVHNDIKDVHEAARHGARLIQKLLGFSRRERLCARPTNVGEVARRTLKRVQRTLPRSINVHVLELPETPCIAVADPDAIEQILMNLINNARDAMPQGGEITIDVSNVVVGDEFVSRHEGAVRGDHVRVAVCDNGTGMESHVLERIFEPFFSTKSMSDGTGLGMAMVYGLTKQQQGYIDVSSAPNVGTTVTVYVPATTDQPQERNEKDEVPKRRAKEHCTILVVEDQHRLRDASRRVLERLGYTVITATDGIDALRCLDEAPGSVDLIVADVVMPHMGGLELHEALLQRGVRLPTLFMSGFSAQDVRSGKQLDPQFRLLQKPWTVDELAGAVELALQSVET